MPMPPYQVICYEPGCGAEACYKIAARWSDGLTSELKTYGLVCEKCLPDWFERSRIKQATCRRASNEILDPPGIYRLEKGRHDEHLDRMLDLETRLASRSGEREAGE